MKLILVRHGETYWNEQKRGQGSSDVELNEAGLEQTRSLEQALSRESINAVYSSPLKRALVTAQAIARPHGLEVNVRPGLSELCLGELEGRTFEEFRKYYAEFLDDWFRDPSCVRIPGGESLSELQERTWPVVEDLLAAHSNDTVVAVSHSFAILSIVCKALGIELVNLRRFRQSVAGISVLSFDGRGANLTLFNDTCHLKG